MDEGKKVLKYDKVSKNEKWNSYQKSVESGTKFNNSTIAKDFCFLF